MLERKYAHLLGDLAAVERQIEDIVGLPAIIAATDLIDRRKAEINEKLEAIETVIWLFDESWDPANVTPIPPRSAKRKTGEISRAAYGILRESPIPLSTRDVAKRVAEQFGVEGEREVASIDSAVAGAFTKRLGRGLYLHEGIPRRWASFPPGGAHPSASSSRPARRSKPGGSLLPS